MEAWGSMLMRSDLYIYIYVFEFWRETGRFPTGYLAFTYIYILMVLFGGFCILFFSCWVDGVWPVDPAGRNRRCRPTREGLNQTASLSFFLSLFLFYCYDFHLFPPFSSSSSSLCASISFTTTCSSGKERRRDLFDTSLVSLWDSVCTHFHRGSLIAIDIYIFFSRLYRLVFPAQKREIGDD